MTGHNNSIQTQNPSFMTTLQATLDILDDVSGAIPENTYLTITNNLQQLYNIHTSNSNSNSNSTSNANPPITTPINYTNNDYVSTISYASIRNFDISNADTVNNNNNNNNIINTIINENIQSLNEESNRMNYSARTRLILYGNVFNNAAN